MAKLNRTTNRILLKRGVAASLTHAENLYGAEAEPLYTTDTKRLYIHNGSIYEVVPTARVIITNNDEVISHNDEVVWLS